MKFCRPPRGTHLYKYYPPETAALVLSNRKVRFSPIRAFNDPFELYTFPNQIFSPFDFGYSLANHILEVIKTEEELKGSDPLSESLIAVIEQFRKGLIKGISAQEFAMNAGVKIAKKRFITEPSQETLKIMQRLANIFGAFCLSEKFDSLLMWAHYAQNHEGVVIGIDPNEVGTDFNSLAPVHYTKSYPTNDDPNLAAARYLGRASYADISGEKALINWFFSKSEEWSYEFEWRAIRDSNIPVDDYFGDYTELLVELPPAAFVSLYIGCRTQSAVADELIRKAKAINPGIQMLKCRPSISSYSLEIHPYEEPWPTLSKVHEGSSTKGTDSA